MSATKSSPDAETWMWELRDYFLVVTLIFFCVSHVTDTKTRNRSETCIVCAVDDDLWRFCYSFGIFQQTICMTSTRLSAFAVLVATSVFSVSPYLSHAATQTDLEMQQTMWTETERAGIIETRRTAERTGGNDSETCRKTSEKWIHGAERCSGRGAASGGFAANEMHEPSQRKARRAGALWGCAETRESVARRDKVRATWSDRRRKSGRAHAGVSMKWKMTVLFTLLASPPCHAARPVL